MKIGVAGATGEVGRMMLKVMEEYEIPVKELRLFASAKSAGNKLIYDKKEVTVEELTDEVMKEHYDYLLFSAGGGTSTRFSPVAAKSGNTVIDNSSAFRSYDEIPLVVPEINGDLLKGYSGIIANPNCSTIQMVLALNGLRDYGIREIVVSTYQSISGAGKKALNVYDRELVLSSEGKNAYTENDVFPKQIFENVIPLIGTIEDDTGISNEDYKMVNETRKIYRDDSITVYPFTARVATRYSHGESVLVKLGEDIDRETFIRKVSETPNVICTDDLKTPIEVAGSDNTYISRIRKMDNGVFMIWVVADNIRVGAATNAVRILMEHRRLNRR
ncbi:MAG TPA: aspartate-semialdehyde dehydrogenase [Thermotogota bacterium]|nr:aspartate-semialdehyde dehydrogenase [Thermotogota bacterium]HPJ87885.1 aspartate-semialdehyde dehydrogenase [Thermotogota bacterium]HPR94978.1 aspartate-semialdehyde dehydrogenase [Thermotogota bacterium]